MIGSKPDDAKDINAVCNTVDQFINTSKIQLTLRLQIPVHRELGYTNSSKLALLQSI